MSIKPNKTLKTLFAACLLSFAFWNHSAAQSPSNEITVTGKFSHYTDETSLDIIGDAVCFYPNEQTSGRITRKAGDDRAVWFCFADTAQAKKVFSIPLTNPKESCGYQGTATVRVSNYEIALGEGEDYDTAKLEEALDISAIAPITCNDVSD